MKNSLEIFNSRISEFKNRTIEIIQSKEEKEKKMKKSEESLRYLWGTIKWIIICIKGVTEKLEKEKETKEYLKKEVLQIPKFNKRYESIN